MTQDEVKELFIKTGAIMEGHFLLTSGLHSPLYVEKFQVLQHPKYTEQLCIALAEKFLKKGNQCYIEGRIQSHKYTDRNGVDKTVYEIIGSELSLIEPNPKDTQENAKNDEPPY